jgi:hypothetical protein
MNLHKILDTTEKVLEKWTMLLKNWASILAQLSIYYEDIVGKYL